MEPSDRWMLLVGFLILAPLGYVLNAGLAVSGAKSVAFCGSCHVMDGYVADLQNPDSEHLAAQHYQFRWIADHQCYTCHSDYGLFGDVQAKMAGLRHVWFYNVGGYELPLKIRNRYDNQRCLFCHGPVKGYREVPEHEKTWARLVDHLLSKYVEPKLIQPTFLLDYPVELSPFAEHEKNAAAIANSEKSCIGGACHVSPHPKEAAQAESAHAS